MSTNKAMTAGRQGFTLVECLVVIAIITTVAGSGLFLSMDSYRGYSFRSDRDSLIALLQHARAQAIGNVCLGDTCTGGMDHGVKIETGRYILFQGSSYAARDIEQDIVITPSPTWGEVGLGEVVFRALSGNPVQSGTVTLTDTAGHSSVITIGDEGQITWSN